MNINDIKAALAHQAESMNVKPIALKTEQPVSKITKNNASSSKTKEVKQPVKRSVGPSKPLKAVDANKVSSNANMNHEKPSVGHQKKIDATIENIVAQNLIAGTDYNTIPGCGRKPALLKAGAEKLAAIFNFRSTSKVINRIERYDQLFVLYEVQTTILDTDGHIIAEGLGSCNSKERKYQRTDFATNLNTILKMAKKRSYVDAVLTATHASGVFTQDIEDIGADLRPVQKEA